MKFQRRRAVLFRHGNLAGLKRITREPRVHPGGGLGVERTRGAHGQAHEFDRAGEIALEPAQVRGARVGMQVGPQIDHVLISNRGFGEFALVHQDVAEQTEIERTPALRDELAGERFGFRKPVQAVQHVTAEQERFEARCARSGRSAGLRPGRLGFAPGPEAGAPFQSERALFGELVITGIEVRARFRDEKPAETFECRGGIRSRAHLRLSAGNFLIQSAVAADRSENDAKRVGRRRGGEAR